MQKIRFSVDAALLKELGERLIGKPHIALAELVKNAYDADASTCRVIFAEDEITVCDDGHGMSFEDFRDHWMRIGTTHKIDARTSRSLQRPLTGSKGIGRLAVQFLARDLTLQTTSELAPKKMLYALVNWGKIEPGQELQSVEVAYENRTSEDIYPYGSSTGTVITLKGLKETWGEERIEKLGSELWRLRSPFRRSRQMPIEKGPADFDIEVEAPHIERAQDLFDRKLDLLFANWKARITGTLEQGRNADATALIKLEFKAGYPVGAAKAARFTQRVRLPVRGFDRREGGQPLIDQARFEILIFKLEGRQGGNIAVGDLRDYLSDFGNVTIYDAGFRLPYYGMQQDWLYIAQDQARRLSISELLPQSLKGPDRYMLDLPHPSRLFGAVEINTRHESGIAEARGASPGQWLQLQPGRDRLHDNAAYSQLRDLVRSSVDFYANRYRARALESVEERRDRERSTVKQERALTLLEENKETIPAPVFRNIRREVQDALKSSRLEEEELDRRAALLAPLATAGMAALALNHELAREIRVLKKATATLRKASKKSGASELEKLAADLEDSTSRLQSLQDLFSPLLSESDKEATDRLRVKPVVQHVVKAIQPLMPNVQFDVSSIPPDLRFPVGSFAEWNALLQNVLTNAWNAMLEVSKPKVYISAATSGKSTAQLRISDNGAGLGTPIPWSDKLFEPFERKLEISEDLRSLAIGGQGLGLTIVRMMAHRRGAQVRFVEPMGGYSTTLEVSWKG